MARNYGLGARDMARAGRYGLQNAARRGELSYQSAATMGERWALFSRWAGTHDVRKMERITPELAIQYGQALADQVNAGTLAAATAQNRLSALNSVMTLATQGRWSRISPTRDAGIPKRTAVRHSAPGGLDRDRLAQAVQQLSPHAGAVVTLCRELGLRSKEASLLNARDAVAQARATGHVTISAGTKGGRARTVPVMAKQQQALTKAAEIQGDRRSLMPVEANWRTWREGELRHAREILQNHGMAGLHDLRASYACERYQALTGYLAPVLIEHTTDSLEKASRAHELEARQQIAQELGHGRVSVTTAYLGGMKR